MQVVMYSPWPNRSFMPQLTQYATDAQARNHKRQKSYTARARDDSLSDLDGGDRLYIVGHGMRGVERIKADGDTPWQESYAAEGYAASNGDVNGTTLDVPGLIRRLVDAGLPTTVSDIRLWVCKGGDMDFTRFALEFTGRIKKRNKSAHVTAYKGYMLLTNGTGRKRGQDTQEARASQPASKHRVLVNTHPTFVKLEELGVYGDL